MFPSVPVVFSLLSVASNADVTSLAFPSLLCPISEPPTLAVTVLAKKVRTDYAFTQLSAGSDHDYLIYGRQIAQQPVLQSRIVHSRQLTLPYLIVVSSAWTVASAIIIAS